MFPHGMWAPNSPDMNLTENVLAMVAIEIHKRNSATVEGLKRAARAAWAQVDEEYLENLVEYHS